MTGSIALGLCERYGTTLHASPSEATVSWSLDSITKSHQLLCSSPKKKYPICRERHWALLTKWRHGPLTTLLIPQAWTLDEGVRPCMNSDLFFPLLG